MNGMKKYRIIAALAVITVFAAMMPCASFAEDALSLEKNSLSFKKCVLSKKVACTDSGTVLKSAGTSDKSVAAARILCDGENRYYAAVYPHKKGKAVITVKDEKGSTAKIKVTVTGTWMKRALKMSSASISYQSKKGFVYTLPGTKVTLKIGGDKYTKKASSKSGTGALETVCVKFNLKKHYRYKTKYSVKVSCGGELYTFKNSVFSTAYVYLDGTIYTCRNTVPVTAYNVLKGDSVCIKVKGKTYKKKMESSAKSRYMVFTTKGNLGYIPELKMYIKDRHGKVLVSRTVKIQWK